jgi:FAD/FMN-containing dehydrogenase
MLPFGNGRSYGDSCLNEGGTLLLGRGLNRFIDFDPATGTLRCEAGVLLADILRFAVPQGWFLPVTPGTQYVTVGGAIANDVHGKNHHKAGTFGQHVRWFELVRSDGARLGCSRDENATLFRATIGGLGLTGVIVAAELKLKRIASPFIALETVRFADLDEFFEISEASDQDYEYTVAWIDCLSHGRALGRGIYMRGNHATSLCSQQPKISQRQLTFPLNPPFSLVNGVTLRAFNELYYHRQRQKSQHRVIHYQPFFYPLDRILAWNRMYGRKGLLQYQCAVPTRHARDAMRAILERIARSGTGSFLTVLKLFGEAASPGLLSFPLRGATLALDFPNRGKPTFELLSALDKVVAAAGGRVYPAKDARMSGESFREYFPSWHEFRNHMDANFSSSFWRRVME